MFTFKAQDKSNAKRFLVKTCKLENFDAYLTQHEGKWGTYLDEAGVPVPFAKVYGVAAAAQCAQQAAEEQAPAPTEAPAPVEVEEVPGPGASAFGAFAVSQLTAEPQPAPADAPKATREGATSTTGLKIEKDRPVVNGVQRQSKGSVGDRLWALYDSIGEGCTLLQAKAMAEAHGLSTTSAAIALYRWRKYNGFANVK